MPADREKAWFQMRAQIAAVLWGVMAEEGVTATELALRSDMGERRVRSILNASAQSMSMFEVFQLGWGLGRRWSVKLEDAATEGENEG